MLEKFEMNEALAAYSDLEKSLEDPLLLAASKEALRRAEQANATAADIVTGSDFTDETTKELDAAVRHLLHQQAQFTGWLQFVSRDDDNEPMQYVEDIGIGFNGFIISRRNGRLSYDYIMTAVLDGEGTVQSRAAIQAAQESNANLSEWSHQTVQAPVDTAFFEFDAIHPVRALAILQTSYPAVLADLDNRIIGGEEYSDEDRLLALAGFEVSLQDMPPEEVAHVKKALWGYINGLLLIDTELPYRVQFDGDYYDISTDDDAVNCISLKGSHLFSMRAVELVEMETPAGSVLKTGLRGMLHSDDALAAGKEGVIPAESVQGIASIRTPGIV